jgi:soluble lytic murein transglycosylase-like protein
LVLAAATKHNLPASLIHAVIQVESSYNPVAVSPKGATGLMQLMEGTAKRYGVSDRTDPEQNINAGSHYLSDLLRLFNQDKRLALAAYNAGENAVKRYNNQIPPFRETQQYVEKVLAIYQAPNS